jgi:hypothetical protein
MNKHTIEDPVSKQWIGKHKTIGVPLEMIFSVWSGKVVIKKSYIENSQSSSGVPSEQLVESWGG